MSEPSDIDRTRMRRVLALAARGRGTAAPNPMVGCVIGRGHQVLGEGFHRACGEAHAEAAALADCRRRGHDPAGATVWVNLEPCCHQGRTPPCTGALIEAGIRRVVIAHEDPNPEVAGGGSRALRDAGVEVIVGVAESAARSLNEAWLRRVTTGRPWVVLKWAQTLDGRTGTRDGDSRWISSDPARQLVHRWRSESDVVMVGAGTARADNPRLDARDVPVQRRARRVILDARLQTPADAAVVTSMTEGAGPVTLVTAAGQSSTEAGQALVDAGVDLLEVEPDAGHPERLDLDQLMAALVEQYQATRVLVEGGATLAGSLLAAGLVNELRVFTAPRLLGDEQGVPAVSGLAPAAIDQATDLQLRSVRRVGADVLMVLRA
ncbi:MAG: bifunctional diaminohydroxyphosphoribosylaminopyrimidine deaminase/5-amino-6-(5-phosphoribosylamino)uracil reductase RibD [Phycisphaeraceae bacterium]|nr:bifunctional diaminohydroxyphosphoribosylaminopyrimidine deaminase/5-amino-6-(5-phosphoribosylamino)uracil reductase RibD [Phycisphaeraceae bacterium]